MDISRRVRYGGAGSVSRGADCNGVVSFILICLFFLDKIGAAA